MITSIARNSVSPALPTARGPITERLFGVLVGNGADVDDLRHVGHRAGEPNDLHLALYACYELHYRGFAGVDPRWEWAPDLIALRNRLEQHFLDDLRANVAGSTDADAALSQLTVAEAESPFGSFLRDDATWEQMRELFAHRSIYHLKEAEPHIWVVPRLQGQAKAAMVAVEFDEFGGGRGDHMHSHLFEKLLTAADLDGTYLGYIDVVPAETLAVVNFMSMCGLHRSLRGALVGHFADVETTSSPGSARMVAALERLGAPAACIHFYAEHIEADAVHEQVVRHDVVGDLLRREPELEADVVFGIEATELLEGRLSDHLDNRWRTGASSLIAARHSRSQDFGD